MAWVPLQAFAQLLPCIPGLTCPSPDNTPPTVSITSPASGATVSGTINVTASASDNRGVADVQFFLDGAPGADDTTAPYSVPWDTTTASNGSHTLTAVARDAAGNSATSTPVTVTVSNAPPPPAAVKRYEETDPSVSFGPGWIQDGGLFGWSGGSAMESQTPGAQATFVFTGTSVTWLGMRGPDSGIARVSIDGVFVSQVDMFARSYEVHVPVFKARGLSNSSHTLTIEVTGLKNTDSQAAMSPFALAVVDAFEVPAQVASHIQDTDPDMSYTAGWTLWDTSRSWSGWYAAVSTTPGAQATLPFNGTSISWIGYRGPDAGIARVYLDGVFAGEVDLYYSDPRVQAIVFTSPTLADANHTITIEATGQKNAASSGPLVAVDAFDVTRPGTRFEETDPSVAYSGSWIQGNLNRAWSMGTISESNSAGATATFTFTGTSVSWIGCRKFTTGIANVYLDGVFVAEIDTFASPREGYQDIIFKATGLASGSHTLTIEATGRQNPAASNNYIVVDAFDVRP
ncbi:MAG TPA: Ig-like domain-containing protein [Burkholderiales bacterium]|nr:Ig-like domain-containing protein [Burkholderiales bacterium]